MKRQEIQVGQCYGCEITRRWRKVLILAESPLGGWYALNLETGKRITIKSAKRLSKWEETHLLRHYPLRYEWLYWVGKLVKNRETKEVLIATAPDDMPLRMWVWTRYGQYGCPMPFPADHMVFFGKIDSLYEELPNDYVRNDCG